MGGQVGVGFPHPMPNAQCPMPNAQCPFPIPQLLSISTYSLTDASCGSS
ncbi:hypothetical protein [Tolypothrix sp. VBCCA 56010]